MVACPICQKPVREPHINRHIDSECQNFIEEPSPPPTQANGTKSKGSKAATFFTPAAKRNISFREEAYESGSSPIVQKQYARTQHSAAKPPSSTAPAPTTGAKRPLEVDDDVPSHEARTAEPSLSLIHI